MKTKIMTAVIGLAFAATAQAQNYPTKPITILVPFAAGGTTDIIARVVADQMSKEIGQTVIVENRGGGGGAIGAAALARAKPDGYTLGISTLSTHAVNPACNPRLNYDAIKSFTSITNLARTPNVLTVSPNFPANDFRGFLEEVKKQQGKLNFASSGQCSVQHMTGELFQVATGTKITHVPYRGAGPAINDLLGSQVDMMFDNLPSSMPHIKGGKLRAFAIAWDKRLPALPNVPTFGELGLKDVNDSAWYGLIGPAGLSPEIVKKLHDATVKALKAPNVIERFEQSGATPVGNTPEEHLEEMRTGLEKMKNLVAKQGITLGD